MLAKLFGSSAPKGPKITKHDRAVLDIKLQRDKIKQYQKKLVLILDREKVLAVKALEKGEKDKALIALRRKRYQESLLSKTDSQFETLEGLISSIEFSQIEISVMHGLAQGNQALKSIHKELSIENVEKLMEESAEAQSYQREIDEMLSSQMTAEDEEAVAEEMKLLQAQTQATSTQQKVSKDQSSVKVPDLPEVPTQEPVISSPQSRKEEKVERRQEEMLAA